MARVKTSSSLEGFEAVRRAFQRAPAEVRALAADAVAKSTFAIYQTALASVPKRTGALRSAIVWTAGGLTGRIGIGPTRGLRRERPDVYWRFIEFGTVKVPARPVFRPAVEREQETFLRRLRDIGPRLERDLSAGRLT